MKAKHIRAYMECAHAFARCSTAERLKVGAVLVKQNRIINGKDVEVALEELQIGR